MVSSCCVGWSLMSLLHLRMLFQGKALHSYVTWLVNMFICTLTRWLQEYNNILRTRELMVLLSQTYLFLWKCFRVYQHTHDFSQLLRNCLGSKHLGYIALLCPPTIVFTCCPFLRNFGFWIASLFKVLCSGWM